MRRHSHISLLFALLTFTSIFSFSDTRSQTIDTTRTINFPLSHEDFSLYDFAEVRFETDKTEIPPVDLATRTFQPVKKTFPNDSLHFDDSVQSAWFKFTVRNNYASDTTIALVFLPAIPKAILYKSEGERLILIGKTGFFLAVIARAIPYDEYRIDLVLIAHSKTNYFLQIPRVGAKIIYGTTKLPALETIAKAEIKAFNKEKEVNRPNFLWSHFFTGVFFMFFVFGFIKYLVFGKDKAYLYYSLLGLCSALVTVAQSEYPPLELPWFENARGIESTDLWIVIGFIVHGLFILEILQLKIKYPRITRVIKWYLFVKFLLIIINKTAWFANHNNSLLGYLEEYDIILFFLLLITWVVYLATIRKGFYRFIFLGALTIFTAYTLMFITRFFNLLYLFPAWFGDDPRGRMYHFMQPALLIDLCFYFTGLAYRDRQVEKDKIAFQKQLIQQLETNKELQEKFTGELEQQVKEKTTELIEQRRALEIEKEAKLLADFNQKFSESELKALRAQMNPHFVFNILIP
jgi:hypothetical protein